MYIINEHENKIEKVQQKTFHELGFRERENLQEWIANNPECLGEDLLIIQKEFNGFNDTNERLDLLALDKQGNLVVIENKLDDSGKDVVWQVLKYVSYCSSLTKQNIVDIYQQYLNKNGKKENAEENITEFYQNTELSELKLNQGSSQRIILIAANFRKEVTSTILWLLNYKIRAQCFKVTPYKHDSQLYLDIEQIIPIQDIGDYVINMAEKVQEDIVVQEVEKERHKLRFDFWTQYLKVVQEKCDYYDNISPSKSNWIGTGSGISGVAFNSVISNYYARVEIYLSRNQKEENKQIFDELFKEKNTIEKEFGNSLVWERLDNKKACRIKYEMSNSDYFNHDDCNKMIEFMAENLPKLINTFSMRLKKIGQKVKQSES
jgi:hypothetical protein